MSSSIKSLLGGAAAAMSAQKSMMNLVGKNIANANTPSYSRQRMPLIAGAFPGMTVSAGSAHAVRTAMIHKSILGAQQGLGFHSGRAQILQLAEPGLNDLDGGGVSQAISDFFLAVSNLAGNPAGSGEREHLLAKARSMSTQIKAAAGTIEDARSAAEDEAALSVTNINSLVQGIADLNGQIHELSNTDHPVGELVDQRDVLLGQLATEMDIQTVEGDLGQVQVYTSSGLSLVDGTNASGVELQGGLNEPLSLAVKKGATLVQMSSPPGGRLGGLFEARDITLKTAGDKLDAMAYAIATEFNAIHEGGFGLDGSTGLSFFEPLAGVAGAARNIELSLDVDGQPNKIAAAADAAFLPGDDANIQALLALQGDDIVAGGLTINEGWDGVVFTVSTALNDAESQTVAAESRAADLEALRASESGVSLHEEMISLSQAERAFQAASRLVETANTLYDAVLRMV